MMKTLILVIALACLPVKAEAPTDARLYCGSLVGKGAIYIPHASGGFGRYEIDCGLSA